MRISDWSSDVCSSDLASRMTSQGSPMTAYEELSRTFTRLRALQEAAGVLQWDMSAMMPSGGAEARTEQLATLSVVCHEILADPSLAELFDDRKSTRLNSSH